MAETQAEKDAREALAKVASEPSPTSVDEWDDYVQRYNQAQADLGKALGEPR